MFGSFSLVFWRLIEPNKGYVLGGGLTMNCIGLCTIWSTAESQLKNHVGYGHFGLLARWMVPKQSSSLAEVPLYLDYWSIFVWKIDINDEFYRIWSDVKVNLFSIIDSMIENEINL